MQSFVDLGVKEAVLTVTTGGSQVEITATVATFGARVARLGNVPLNRAYPPLADVELNELMNGQPIRESIFP